MPRFAKLRTDLVSSPSTVDGVTVYTVKDPKTGNYFRLREPEFRLLGLLDGATSEEQIAQRLREEFEINISADDVTQFVAAMDRLVFLENSRSEQTTGRASYGAVGQRSRLGRLLFIKIRAFRPGAFLEQLVRIYRPFHRRVWLIVAGMGTLMGLAVLAVNLRHFEISPLELWHLGSLVTLVLSILISISIHEFAHAVICRIYGGEVREIGFLLLYFQPCFYCDLSDAWLFQRKSHRLAVTAAGPFFQLMLLAASVILWRVTMPGTFINELFWMLVTVNWLTFLLNFNPLIKLDGYYLLSDWLDIPNLRRKAFVYLGNLFQRRLLGWPVETPETPLRQRRIFIAYSLTALVYSFLLLGYLFWLASKFLLVKTGPAGLMLFFVILLVTFRSAFKELAGGFVRHIKHMRQLLKKPFRLASYLAVFAVVLVLCLAVPLPQRVSGDVMVRPIAQFSLSLNEFGLLESLTRYGGDSPESKSSFLQMASSDMAALELLPVVKDGQPVQRGDTVALITSNQITREIESGQAELDRLEGKLALLKAPPKKEEVAEAEARVTAARANLNRLQREQERIQELVSRSLETTERLETSQSGVEIARAELAKLVSAVELLQAPPRPEEEAVILHEIQKQKAQLEFLREQAQAQHIVAPINGFILSGQKDGRILTVADCQTVELLVPVSDFDIPLIQLGQTVQVKVRSYPDRTFPGEVVRIPEVAEEFADGVFFLIAVVVENQDRLLRDGMSGYAKIEIGKSSLADLGLRKLFSLLKVEFWSWW